MLYAQDIHRIRDLTAPVLSLYLNVDPGYPENQALTPAWRIWLKNELKRLEEEVHGRDAQREWRAIRDAAERFIDGYRPESRGLIVFVNVEGVDVYTLPLAVDNQAGYGQPLVTPLFWKLDEFERYLVVLVDQQEARFLTAYLGTVGEQERMEIDIDLYDFAQKTINPATSSGRELNQGSNREAFEDMLDEHRSRFLREVADHIGTMSGMYQTERIILGGAEESAHALRRMLTDRLAQDVVAVLPIPLRAAPHEVLAKIQPAAHAYERDFEMALVTDVIDQAKSGGRAALGQAAVLRALSEQRVEQVIAPWPMTDDFLLHELPTRMMDSSSRLELVHGAAAQRLQAEGGLAARLYYVLPSGQDSSETTPDQGWPGR